MGPDWDFLPDYQVAAGFWIHNDFGLANWPAEGSVTVDWGDGHSQFSDVEEVTTGAPLAPGAAYPDVYWVHSYAEPGLHEGSFEVSGMKNEASDGSGANYVCSDHGPITTWHAWRRWSPGAYSATRGGWWQSIGS